MAIRDKATAGNLVLIADDNADIQAVLGILLRGAGFQTVTAYDGEEAVNVAAQTQPDLVLMDLVLPRLDGLAAARRIRNMAGLERVPIVGCSAYEPEEEEEPALKESAFTQTGAPLNAFLHKPTDFSTLLMVMHRLLGQLPQAPVKSH
jgi:CheY-like chemotaxis protein